MKSKREILESIQELHSEYMGLWSFFHFGFNKLIPFKTTAKEEHYLIVNAANKFWNLINE